jgi:hypothetical protein
MTNIEKLISWIFILIVVIFAFSVIGITAFLMGYFPTESKDSGDAKVNSPLSLSVPVFECDEGEHIIIDGVLTEYCTGDHQSAGNLWIPGDYENEKR